MPKKKLNAFYFFMIEMKDEMEKKGINVNLKDMPQHVSELWKKLSETERARYDMMAQEAKGNFKSRKLTTQGVCINKVLEMNEKQKIFNDNMLAEIKHTLEVAEENLDMIQFYIIHINIFCFVNSCQQYYPAEVAVVRFNLRNGVANEAEVYHSFCKPGELPLGYAYAVKDQASTTHQIDYPLDEPCNIDTVFMEVLRFIQKDVKKRGELPPLYAFNENMSICTDIIKSWCFNSGYREDYVKIYALEQLFYHLRNGFCKLKGLPFAFPSVSSGRLELEKDVYDYTKGIGCDVHENSDAANYCSKSFVIRWAYIICDNCCPDWKIQLIPGQHVPKQADVSANKRAAKKHPYPSIASDDNKNEFSTTTLPSISCQHENDESSFIETDTPSQVCDNFNPGSYGSQEVAQRDYTFLSCSQESSELSADMNETISQTSFTSCSPFQASLPRRPFTLSAALAQRRRGLSSNVAKGVKFSGSFNKLTIDDLLDEDLASPSDYSSQDDTGAKKRM